MNSCVSGNPLFFSDVHDCSRIIGLSRCLIKTRTTNEPACKSRKGQVRKRELGKSQEHRLRAAVVTHFSLHLPPFSLTLHTLHLTLYTPDSTLHTLHFTHYTLHSTLFTLHSILYTLHFTLLTAHFTLYTSHFTLHFHPLSTPYTLHSTHCTLHFTLHFKGKIRHHGHESSHRRGR